MDKSPIFIFSTPEGGGEEIKDFLEKSGYNIFSQLNKYPQLEQLFQYCQKCSNKNFQKVLSLLIKNLFFKEEPVLWGYRDYYTGILNKDRSFFEFLFNNIKESKFIFCHRELEKNLCLLLSKKDKWIPCYGTCFSSSERNLKHQISNYQLIDQLFQKRSIIIDTNSLYEEKLTNFINLPVV